jgi:hypothetical protein
MGRRSSQIFADKLFQVRLAAEKAMPQSPRVELAFFSPQAMALIGFKICVQYLAAIAEFHL